jgi:glycosyltransferase involved in cell wall biosynthesis
MLGIQYFIAQAQARDTESRSAVYLDFGTQFARKVAKAGFGEADAVYTFNTAALEILQAARKRGLFTVLEQTIAPRAYEEQLLAEEQTRFPGWEVARFNGPATEATIRRERAEWGLADLILCGSEFVREGVAKCGGPVDRCVVVPYGVDGRFAPVDRTGRTGPLRVLTAGEAGLRKGAPYAAEVARLMGAEAEFRWLGKVTLEEAGRRAVEPWVDLKGIVPRNEVKPHFEWADVFFLPSICEGSATVTYEALMSGLPVVTTPNAGSIVRDGMDGFIVPVRDATAMAQRLSKLNEDRELLARMREATRESVKEASLEAYQRRLLGVLKA